MNIVKNVFFAVILLVGFAIQTNATTHQILFGGATGFQYAPNSLNVAIGDTIVWSGDFGTHPLKSLSVPPTATPISNSSGTVYSYIIKVEGSYTYHCEKHSSMTGTITTTSASVRENAIATIALLNYPNPVGSSTSFHFNLPASGNVSMKLYDIKGYMVADVMNGYRPSGENEVSLNTQNLANGTYICKFESGVYHITHEIVVVK